MQTEEEQTKRLHSTGETLGQFLFEKVNLTEYVKIDKAQRKNKYFNFILFLGPSDFHALKPTIHIYL